MVENENTMLLVVKERLARMADNQAPRWGRMETHAHGNIFGSYHVKVDEGKMSEDELRQAADAYNTLVPEGGRVEVFDNANGKKRTRLVER